MRANIQIFNEDCMPAMARMSDNAYALAIVDPPYGIGQVWSKSRKDRFFHKKSNYTNKKKPPKKYFTELLRISKNQIIWGWNYFCHYLPETNHIIVWDKDRDCEKTYMSEIEMAWHSFTTPARIYEHEWDGARKGCERGIVKIHPFQKPIGLYKWLLKNYAKEGNTILDTHGGSMSLAIACWDMGFDLTVYEIDKEYYDNAVARLERHKSQGQLF